MALKREAVPRAKLSTGTAGKIPISLGAIPKRSIIVSVSVAHKRRSRQRIGVRTASKLMNPPTTAIVVASEAVKGYGSI